eukprot:g1298.t1
MKAEGGGFLVASPGKAIPSLETHKTSVALARQHHHHQQEELEEIDEYRISAFKKPRVGGGQRQPASLPTVAEEDVEDAQHSCSEDSSEEANGLDEAESGKLPGWAPPGLGVCQLWAQQASSLKRKNGSSASTPFPPFSFSDSSSSLPASTERRPRAAVAVGFGIDDAVPATREDKAKLVGGYLGTSRPGYGDASRTPVWWPAEVPWLKGVSISQMNNATLHTLVLAVKAHQRQERRQALASGAELPDGLFAFTPKTKKEMSRLIRSIQGRRLEYGKEGKRPSWWPKNCPWDNHKPLSTMKHAEVTSIFKAMVREGLLSDADVNGTSSKTAQHTGPVKNGDNDGAVDGQAEDSAEAISDNDSQGGGGHHLSASDSSSERSSSFWDGEDKGVVGDVVDEISPLCETIDPDSAEDLPLPLLVQQQVACGLMPPSTQQEHPQQQALAQQHQQHQQLHFLLQQQQQLLLQKQQQQHQQQRPLEFHGGGGGLGLNTPPVAPVTTATNSSPGLVQQALGKLSSSSSSSSSSASSSSSSSPSHGKVDGFLVAGQAGKCSPPTAAAPSLLESVPCSPTKAPPPVAETPDTDEDDAWQGRAFFEELLLGGLNGPQLCGFFGEDVGGGASTERMFGFSALDDDLVFPVGGQVKPLQ